MTFSEFVKILYLHSNIKKEVPSDFVLTIISSILTDSGVSKCDLLTSSDDTTRKIYNGERPISQVQASLINSHLDKPKFIAYFNNLSADSSEGLIRTLALNGIQTTKQNYPEDCADLFEQILISIIGGGELDNRDLYTPSKTTISKYSTALLHETGGHCPNEGCANSLFTKKDGVQAPLCSITRIQLTEEDIFENLIALCPICHNKYTTNPTEKETTNLQEIKASLMRTTSATELLSEVTIETEIINLLLMIDTVDDDKLPPLTFDPVSVKMKIGGDDKPLLRKVYLLL